MVVGIVGDGVFYDPVDVLGLGWSGSVLRILSVIRGGWVW
jgi:hypothetical protein